MPNRRAVTRGGALEATILESIRAGHTIRAACGAAGVAVRTYYNFAERSQAHRNDREIAEQEAERRLVGRVLEAADGGSVKAAQWLLERRWPQVYGALQRIDARVESHAEVDVEILALAQRYSGLTNDEVAAETRRLDWVVPQAADDNGQERIAGDPSGRVVPLLPSGEGSAEGDGAALPAATRDEAANVSPDSAESTEAPEPQANGRYGPPQPAEAQPPLEWHSGPEPIRCIHCRGTHEAACPHAVEGTYRIDPGDVHRVLGDPR